MDFMPNCPLCGNLHDDGTFYKDDKRMWFVCFECDEKYSKAEILEKLKKKYIKKGI